MFILSCDTVENGGGIYKFNDNFEFLKYYPCDRPMYACRNKYELCVLLRAPFIDNNFSGYFFIDEDLQKSTKINDTKGVVACHLELNQDGVYVVNYLSGNIVKNGEKICERFGNGINKDRQDKPHTHFVKNIEENCYGVCDLGTDTLAFYDKDLNLISEVKVPEGYGIRHFVLSDDKKHIYAINELLPSISVFEYGEGNAKLIDTVKVKCDNFLANGAAIRLSKNGKFLYASFRIENVICVFSVDGDKLKLLQKVSCLGDGPRDFNVIGNRLCVCNENSNNVVIYNIENDLIKEKIAEISVSHPLCVL